MNKELKIGLVIADIDEYKPLAEHIEKGEYESYNVLSRQGHKFTVSLDGLSVTVLAVCCGIGKVNAAAAAMKLIDDGCNIILNYGLSGGISGVHRGDLCVCNQYLEHDFDLTGIGYKLCEKPSQKYIYDADKRLIKIVKDLIPQVKSGTAISGDHFICDAEERKVLKETFGAMSCDMETAAIAYVCDASGVPFVALRRISDDAGDDAIDNYRDMNTSNETVLSDLILDLIKKIISSNEF